MNCIGHRGHCFDVIFIWGQKSSCFFETWPCVLIVSKELDLLKILGFLSYKPIVCVLLDSLYSLKQKCKSPPGGEGEDTTIREDAAA